MVLQYYTDRLRLRLSIDDEMFVEEFKDGKWSYVKSFKLRHLADDFGRRYSVYSLKDWK